MEREDIVYIYLNWETKEFVKRLDLWQKKKRDVNENFKVFGLSNLKYMVDIIQN